MAKKTASNANKQAQSWGGTNTFKLPEMVFATEPSKLCATACARKIGQTFVKTI